MFHKHKSLVLLSDKIRTTTYRMGLQLICRTANFPECHVAVLLWKIFLPVFFLIGVPGNILSLVVLSRKRMRNSTTSVYLRLLAIVDTTVLLIGVPRNILYYYESINVTNLSNFTCKFYLYLNPSFVAISWCLLPIITLDRFIHVRYPIWAKEHCSRKKSVIIFAVMVVTVLAISSPRAAFYSTREVKVSQNLTKVLCAPTSTWLTHFKAFPTIFSLLFSVTPVFFQLVCNVLLVKQLTDRSRQKKARQILEAGQKKEQQDLRCITRMLLVVCVFFILSSVPQCTLFVFRSYIFDSNKRHEVAKQQLVQTIVQILVYSSNSINFLLYTVSGRMFRKELCTTFLHAKRPVLKWLGRSVHPMETSYELDGTTKGKTTGECSLETKTTGIGKY